MTNYTGIIIEESLKDPVILQDLKIISTEIEPVTGEHQTPNLKQWTMHTIEISAEKVDAAANKLARAIDDSNLNGHWYADFKNNVYHYIIFPGQVFKVDQSNPSQYQTVVAYGLSLGIPRHQLDFSPQIDEWNR